MTLASSLWSTCIDIRYSALPTILLAPTSINPSLKSYNQLYYLPHYELLEKFIGESMSCDITFDADSTVCSILSSMRDILSTFTTDGYISTDEIDLITGKELIRSYPENSDYALAHSIFNSDDKRFSHTYAALLPSVKLNSWLLKRTPRCVEQNTSSHDLLIQHLESLLEYYVTVDYPTLDFGDKLSSIYLQALRRHAAVLMDTGDNVWPGLVHLNSVGVDFDDTLTEGDTVSRLCKAALRKQSNDPAAVEAIYGELQSNYMTSYADFMHRSLEQLQANASADPMQYTFQSMQGEFAAFIASYSEFERDMLLPLEGAQALRGLTEEDILAVADDIPLKAGSLRALDFALGQRPQLQVTLLSLNWSRKMLSRAVAARLASQSAVSAGRVVVFANELVLCDSNRFSTGAIDKLVTGPLDKAVIFRTVTRTGDGKYDEQENGSGRLLAAARSVFIGDSVGDLSAMLEADVGVIIGSSSSLRRVCNIFGITLASLDTVVASATTTYTHAAVPVLYLADSWTHIGVVLFGREFSASIIAENDREVDR